MSEYTLPRDPAELADALAPEAVLDAARRRTLALTDCLGDDELMAQHSPLMSPLGWDLAHIGNQEEIWLVRRAGGRPPLRPDLDPLYDAFRHPRADRPALPLLKPGPARRYLAEVREAALEILESTPATRTAPTRCSATASSSA